MPSPTPSRGALELTVAANFVEVFLAREGHDGPVGINYLEKIQLPTLPALHGALLAGVSCVVMGAGIPRAIPGAMASLAEGRRAELAITVDGAPPTSSGRLTMAYDPAELFEGSAPTTALPAFLPIVSSVPLASMLKRKASGPVDGFVIEAPTAGGHNAPPRGAVEYDDEGQPVYGERDEVDLAAMAALGMPFWLAGGQGGPGRLEEARARGAHGIQVGTAFAYCEESGMDVDLRRSILAGVREGRSAVRTDPKASPTGFPFKVLPHPGSMGAPQEPQELSREVICDLGYLRQAHRRTDGKIVWRCPAEPAKSWLAKGGDPAEVEGRKCVCNGLMATAGSPQVRKDGRVEEPLVTSGDALAELSRLLPEGGGDYTAADVIAYLLQPAPAPASAGSVPA